MWRVGLGQVSLGRVVRNSSGSKVRDVVVKKISSTGSPFFIEYFTKKSRCSQ